ncbi:hypothetical protein EYF80_019491 [Liparis tanakae]|uniref:Uncharacterized protein n=1 Tax=Liparis tanakae TaxID=230148 RepID=A0A4Z2HX63_9TELE|nr:hypothetical protein EYF80_019491 [Liparis tanakae]
MPNEKGQRVAKRVGREPSLTLRCTEHTAVENEMQGSQVLKTGKQMQGSQVLKTGKRERLISPRWPLVGLRASPSVSFSLLALSTAVPLITVVVTVPPPVLSAAVLDFKKNPNCPSFLFGRKSATSKIVDGRLVTN